MCAQFINCEISRPENTDQHRHCSAPWHRSALRRQNAFQAMISTRSELKPCEIAPSESLKPTSHRISLASSTPILYPLPPRLIQYVSAIHFLYQDYFEDSAPHSSLSKRLPLCIGCSAFGRLTSFAIKTPQRRLLQHLAAVRFGQEPNMIIFPSVSFIASCLLSYKLIADQTRRIIYASLRILCSPKIHLQQISHLLLTIIIFVYSDYHLSVCIGMVILCPSAHS